MAITEWLAPSSGGTIASSSPSYFNVYHAGDYWFALARLTTTTLEVRYATDPSGAWSSAGTVTTAVTMTPADCGGVQYDGTHYAYAYAAGTASRIMYATDPADTWTAHQFDTSGEYTPQALLFDGTRWIMAGRRAVASPAPAFIGYTAAGSAVTSTWTFDSSDAGTGYTLADLGPSGTRNWTIDGLSFDGTHYVAAASRSPASGLGGHLRYCTDITAASWSTPTTAQIEDVNELRHYADAGYWVSMGPNPVPYYATDPTGTWSALGTASTGLDLEVLGLAYGDGYWVATGRVSTPSTGPGMAHLSGASPGGTYTLLTSSQHGFGTDSSQIIYTVECHGRRWVAGANIDTELRYALSPTTRPLLRQRQSPKRTPSRVRGVDLRQRQTPFIR